MAVTSLRSWLHVLSPTWAFGPIFAKELRVSSRHRRNYVLRFAYLLALTVYVAVVWADQVRWVRAGNVFTASRMAEVGKNITAYAVLFQFYAAQLVTIIILSTSFSDEIYHRTLGVLMTTPITNRQIVLGKLLSKLLQLLLLLSITVPLLAIVRVFGGVAWGYVISTLCITATAVLFVGSVTILMSMLFRQSYTVIIVTLVAVGVLFGLSSVLIATFEGRRGSFITLAHTNPCLMLAIVTERLVGPAFGRRLTISWPTHCLLMTGASAAVLCLCTTLVRKVALFQAASRTGLVLRMWRSGWQGLAGLRPARRPSQQIRRVTGPPVVWKELVCRLAKGEKYVATVTIGTEIAMVIAVCLYLPVAGMVGFDDAHKYYVQVFMGMGLLFTAILAATCITAEKEAHSWPLLLTTTLSNREIIAGKISGVLRRCLPVWTLLFAYIALFWYAKFLRGIAVIQIAIIVVGILVLVTGSGLYLSSRCKRTGVAVISNLVLVACLWLILAMLPSLPIRIFWPDWKDWSEFSQYAVPFVQANVVIDAAADVNFLAPRYEWPDVNLGVTMSTLIMLASTAGYLLLSLFFVALAKRRLRRDPF